MVTRVIDNPGRGKCAFFSFSIGLMDMIKHQCARDPRGRSAIFETFQNLSVAALGLSSVDELNISLDEIKKFNYNKQSFQLLDKMQRCFRHIIYHHRTSDLRAGGLNFDNGVGPTAFFDFNELVRCFAKNDFQSAQFIGLINFPAARAYAEKAANEIKSIMKRLTEWYPSKRADEAYTTARNKYMLKHFDHYASEIIFKAFNDDVYNQAGEVNDSSCIVAALRDVTVESRWGTHQDLDELAHIFNIKLGVRTYSERGSYQNIPAGAAFTLNNWGNGHWNTSLTFLGTFAGKKYDTFTKDSVISKEEIKEILLTYTTGWKSIFTPRHHLDIAKQLIKDCDNETINVTTIANKLSRYMTETNFAKNSSFIKRAHYIIARAEYSLAPAKDAGKFIEPSSLNL
ncbi:Dot/Icm T4SS effector [Legionella beliardensis]|uniref:Dot/Icm T4SS effector n=1 Tax=Legionella beliardensis TaxID=91822 RepID=A0A378I0S5_9GAMM|nr:hypothetical protein [Legionella beliardensis]STX28572.1 Dot/Icm T4SS effector [Legionella beliardensis]